MLLGFFILGIITLKITVNLLLIQTCKFYLHIEEFIYNFLIIVIVGNDGL